MKKLFLLVLVLAALTVFCSAAFAQYGYAVPTLETVRRDGSTANVYTYRDANGNKIREIEYYVNDDGSYGNLDVYYGSGGLTGFRVRTDYKNGVCTVSEQSTSYSADGSATINSRETTFNPDGNVNVLTYTTQELENDKTVTTGMETDGMGRKIGDFMEERWKDTDNNDISRRTVYNPDKTVNITHRTENRDGTEIRMERTYDENDREIYSLYIEYDNEDEAVYTEAAKLSYGEGGQVSSENLIVFGPEGKQLRFIEKWNESDTTSTAEGELLDKEGNKLADYSFERTVINGESEVKVDTYVYPNGRVDIISKTVDEDGNITIKKQLDFKAAGEETGETIGDDIDYDVLYNWPGEKSANDIDEPDDELIRYFEDISDIWGENIVGDNDYRDDESGYAPDDVPEDLAEFFDDSLNDEIDDSVWESDETGDDDSDSDIRDEDDGGSSDWSGDSGSSTGWTGDNGSSSDWSGDSGGSDNWGGDDGGSDDWDGDDGGSDDWDGDDSGSDDWDDDDGGFDD